MSAAAAAFILRVRRVHGCRAGDQFRGAFGDAGGADAPARLASSRASARWRLRRARPRPPRPRPAHPRRRALAARRGGGAGARHLVVPVIGIAAEPLGLPDRLRRPRLARASGRWRWSAGLAGLGAVSGRVATHVPGRLRRRSRSASASSARTSSPSTPLGLQPGIDWQLLPLVAAFAGAAGGCMMALGAFFRGGDRSKPATVRLAGDRRPRLRRHPGRQPAARARRRPGSAAGVRADRLAQRAIASATLALLASVGSIALLSSACSSRSSRRACAGRCAAPRPSCSAARFRDGLTGLPNRLMFEGMLAQAVQQADGSARAHGDALHRPRRLQAGQRVARPRTSATWCCARSRPG